MKKVLILSGSPRKGGNSDTLCDAFLKGAQAAGHMVEKIRISEKKHSLLFGMRRVQSDASVHSKR